MKLNRNALIAAAVTITATLAVGALAANQTKPGAKGDGKGCHRGMHLGKIAAEKLNLTEAQQEKLKAIRTDLKAKAKAIKANESLDRESKKSQFKALRDAAKLQIDQVLTSDQEAQIEKMKADRKVRKGTRPGKTTSA